MPVEGTLGGDQDVSQAKTQFEEILSQIDSGFDLYHDQAGRDQDSPLCSRGYGPTTPSHPQVEIKKAPASGYSSASTENVTLDPSLEKRPHPAHFQGAESAAFHSFVSEPTATRPKPAWGDQATSPHKTSEATSAEARRKTMPPPFQQAFGTSWKSVSHGTSDAQSNSAAGSFAGNHATAAGRVQPPPPPLPGEKPRASAKPRPKASSSSARESCSSQSTQPKPRTKTNVQRDRGQEPAASPATVRLPHGVAWPDMPASRLAVEGLYAKLTAVPLDERRKVFKAACFEWHPDKNPSNEDVATEVFQFLQRLKSWYLGT